MPFSRQRVRIATHLVALLLPFVALSARAAPAAAQQTRFTRPIEVPQAGWIEVPLDPDILRRAAPAGGHLRLFGPEGEEVVFARMASEEVGDRVPAEVMSAEQTETGWSMVFQVPPGEGGSLRHDRLVLSLEGEPFEGPSAAAARLEGSDDGEAWTLLAVGRLERGAGGDALFTYPASEHRYLRLWWPRGVAGQAPVVDEEDGGDGAPLLRSAAVEVVPRRALGIALERPACQSPVAAVAPAASSAGGEAGDRAGGSEPGQGTGPSLEPGRGERAGFAAGPRAVCPLPLGVEYRLLHRLDLAVEAREPVGYRLLVPEAGRWEVVAEGVWAAPVSEAPHALDLDLLDLVDLIGGRERPLPATPEPVRLELYGSGSEVPSLTRVGAEVRAQSLVFEARRAGRHTLAYGPGIYRSSRSAEVRPPSAVEPVRIEPGVEELGAAVANEPSLPAAGDPAPSVRFTRRWQVAADAPEVGTLHRLEVSPEVYGVARSDLGDLRLLAGAAQVPYLRWRPAAPSLAAALGAVVPEVDPRGAGEAGRMRLGIDLDLPELPYSAVVVHARAERFRGRVRLLAIDAPAADDDEPRFRSLTRWLDWACDPLPPLSCRRVIGLGDGTAAPEGTEPPRRLVLEVEPSAGEGGAPGALDVELLRHRDVLLFPWPGQGQEVRLVAGAPDLGAPDYELGDRLAELLARPSRRAELGPEGGEPERDRRVGGWTMVLTLLVGLGALLWLLNGILAAREPV